MNNKIPPQLPFETPAGNIQIFRQLTGKKKTNEVLYIVKSEDGITVLNCGFKYNLENKNIVELVKRDEFNRLKVIVSSI